MKDLFISSSLPLPTNPVEVDGLLTIDGSPDRVQGAVTGTSSGYGPGATGHLYAASQPIHLGAFTADAQGVIHFDVTVPSKLTGAHHLVMVGNNPAGNVKASVLSVTIIGGIGPDAAATPTGPAPSTNSTTVPAVKAAVAPNQLAITGADLFGLVFAAAAFIVAGALTLRRNRARSLSCDEIAHGH